jgi:competence ComEA-like helix-hairpin-helix protein
MSRLPRIPEFWSASQRAALIAFVLILSGVLLYRLYSDRQYVSNPQPQRGARADELADRLDPNHATWQELAVIPQLGQKRAQAIVATRQRGRTIDPDRVTFAHAEDLLAVPGIGSAMLESLRPYLIFPTTRPSVAGR